MIGSWQCEYKVRGAGLLFAAVTAVVCDQWPGGSEH
jgi:hypothetical protein